MQALLNKMTQFRAIGDLIGLIVGGIAFLAFIGWAIYQICKDKKAKGNIVTMGVDVQKNGIEYDIISWPN